jgi:hypothetical protein
MSSFTEQIPFFFKNFLSLYTTAIPKGPLWALTFSDFPVNAILRAAQEEPVSWEEIQGKLRVIMSNTQALKTKGCLFANRCQIPGESLVVNPIGIQKNQFGRTFYGEGRDLTSGLQIGFLETNDNIVENVMRPWVVATGKYGLIAQEGDKNYRTDLDIWKFNSPALNYPMNILQHYKFKGVAPISVPETEFTYDPATGPVVKSVTFTYLTYSVA